MPPMIIHLSTSPKCGIFEVSRFHKRENRSSIKTPWRFSCQPANTAAHHLARHRNFVLQAKGFRYQKMSSQVVEKTESNVVVDDCLQDLPLSTSYETAMEALTSLITRKKRGDHLSVGGKYGKLDRMQMYLKILGLEEHIVGLKIIHVAGTKGKGSTCAFCEAILRECGYRTGLFTSPHLIDVRERFRIDGLDISEDKFLQYFWDCWNQLKEHVTEDLPMPPLFQFLTILAFKIFVCEQVDVAIIEVGLGGKKDSTNVIKEPVVCGITSLGMDHTEILGNTLGEIASHKAGIFKPQIPAFTVSQHVEAMDVLQEKADELKVPLKVALLEHNKLDGLTLSLSGDHQFTNAGLAVSLCKCWLQRTGNWNKLFQDLWNVKQNNWEANLPEAFRRGLSTARLSGRAQIFCDSSSNSCISSDLAENSSGDLIFYLDGAHSPENMEVCAKWFCSATKTENKSLAILSPSAHDIEKGKEVWVNGYNNREWGSVDELNKISKKILLFNCMEVRDPQILLPRLVSSCASSGTYFSKAIFVPSMSTYNKVTSSSSIIPSSTSYKDLSWQFSLQRFWEKIIHGIELDSLLDKSAKMDGTDALPPYEFLYEDASHCRPTDIHFACSTVFPSLPLTIKWLRDCVRENPSLRVQVLVTGSLHLVGDVLKLLKR